MDEMKLPEGFLDHMKRLLGDEYEAFLASFREGRRNALRVNLLKSSPEEFERTAPFPVKKVPWTVNGYYVDYRDAPGRHPWYRAGVYYLQEPSAMAPAQILPVSPGDHVLDLCAAPGGKATELGARLDGRGILIANEISASRVKALVRNIELFGIVNAVVTRETPARLAERFEGYFDRVLVDAPCSGEGMFRKDAEAAKAWYPEKVSECAKIQREIILNAADMLRPGGDMVYSTCTFEPEENELVIAHLLRERPDMELVKIPCTEGRADFREAYSLQELTDRGYDVLGSGMPKDALSETGKKEQEAAAAAECDAQMSDDVKEHEPVICSHSEDASFAISTEAPDLTCAVRIWPHHAGGEGHFIALLHKKTSAAERSHNRGASAAERSHNRGASATERSHNRGASAAERTYDRDASAAERSHDRSAGAAERTYDRDASAKERSLSERKSEAKGKKSKKKTQQKKNRKEAAPDLVMAEQFLAAYASDLYMDMYRYEVRDSHVYLMPEECPDIRGLAFLRAGLHAGELKKGRFEPSQELALALGQVKPPKIEKTDEIFDDGIHMNLPTGSEQLDAYLRGEQIRLNEAGSNGWRLVLADGYPVGWGKLTGCVLKNHLGAGWRS